MGAPTGVSTPSVRGLPGYPEVLAEQAAALLQHTYRWLDEAVVDVPQLAGAVPATITAVELYEAGQFHACLQQIVAVIAGLQQARAAYPTLPAL